MAEGGGGSSTSSLRQARSSCATSDPDDALLLRLRDDICKAHGWDQPSQCDREARKQWLARLAFERPFAVKGLKASPSRWFTIVRAISTNASTCHTKLWGLTLLAIKKGWVGHWDEMFTTTKDTARCKAISMQSASARPASVNAPASESVRGSASSSGAKPSTAAAKAEARQAVSSIRQRSFNALHAVGRLMADHELYVLQQLVRLVTWPLQREHNEIAQLLKGEAGTLEYYALQAAGHWHIALSQMVALMRDLRTLQRIGFETELTPNMKKSVNEKSGEVAAQDNLAGTMWKALACLMSHRCAIMSAHSYAYPFVLGGVNSNDEFIVAETFKTFKLQWEAYAGARLQPLPLPRQLAERCTLNTRCMESTARIIRRAGYTKTKEVVQRCEVLFRGWGQERIVEDSLKHIREAEQRDTNNQSMRLWRSFEVPRTAKLIGQCDRRELEPTNLADLTFGSSQEAIFHPNTIATDCQKHIDLKANMSKQDWATFNAITFKRLPSEMSLMMECHRRGGWALASEAWRSTVLPTHQIVVQEQPDGTALPFFVLSSTMSAALLWPMERVHGHCFTFRLHSTSQWMPVFGLRMWKALPWKIVSPLRCFLTSGFPADSLGIGAFCEPPVDILKFQAGRVFQGAPEMSLKKLCAELGCNTIAAGDTSVDAETCMAVDLMRNLLPTLDQSEANGILLQRLQADTTLCDATLKEFATGDMLGDVILPGDQREINRFVEDMGDAKSRRKELMPKVVEHIAKTFPKRGRAQSSAVAQAASKAKVATQSGQHDGGRRSSPRRGSWRSGNRRR